MTLIEKRVETGKVQVGDDWPGVFIRGDNALHFGAVLKAFLGGSDNPMNRAVLAGLANTLLKAEARNGIAPVMLSRPALPARGVGVEPLTLTKPDRTEKNRRNAMTYDEQMRDAEASCVPCKLCGGKAKIEDAGPGWGYVIGCENYGKRKNDCFQYGARHSGWAYNVAERWNELNALAAPSPAPVEAQAREAALREAMTACDYVFDAATEAGVAVGAHECRTKIKALMGIKP